MADYEMLVTFALRIPREAPASTRNRGRGRTKSGGNRLLGKYTTVTAHLVRCGRADETVVPGTRVTFGADWTPLSDVVVGVRRFVADADEPKVLLSVVPEETVGPVRALFDDEVKLREEVERTGWEVREVLVASHQTGDKEIETVFETENQSRRRLHSLDDDADSELL